MPKICVTLVERDLKSTVAAARGLKCDIVEVRLDHLKDRGGFELLGKLRQNVMVTCIPKWEGGRWGGSEGDRVAFLKSALRYADYVSVELRMGKRLRDGLIAEARRRKVKVIVAYHDSKGTPPVGEIVRVLRDEAKAGADVAKVAYMPKDIDDVVSLLEAQVKAKLKIPVIALSMGEMGRITRIVGPMLGGYLTFAAPSRRKRAAAGQYSLDEMKEIGRLIWV